MSDNRYDIPAEYEPLSMWAYFGYQILFSIPFVGVVLLIILSFAPRNKNLKNFARSYFCFLIIIAIIVGIFAAAGGLGSLLYMIRQ